MERDLETKRELLFRSNEQCCHMDKDYNINFKDPETSSGSINSFPLNFFPLSNCFFKRK